MINQDNNNEILVDNSALYIENLYHSYHKSEFNNWTLNSINLNIKKGELLGLLGPSGCGKTTLLRLIAGFESPNKGRIFLGNTEISSSKQFIPPERRNIGMVFQDYALFPHLNVIKNATFGLKNKSQKSRVHYLLEILGIDNLADRYPHELSGGQKQRLAIARALAPGTSFLLLDEPFCSLDLNVRLRLRSELPTILKSCNTSALMVTHDPEEAMAICDKVAVMSEGKIHQHETPIGLINNPKTLFVSSFILGNNILKIKLMQNIVRSSLGNLKVSNYSENREVRFLSISPKSISLSESEDGAAKVVAKEFLGEFFIYKISIGLDTLRVRTNLNININIGSKCNIKLLKNSEFFLYPGGYKNLII